MQEDLFMAMIVLHCPDCGNEIKIDAGKEFCFCDECGRKILIPAQKAEAEPETPAPASEPEAPASEPEVPAAEPEVPAAEAPVSEPASEPEAPAAEPEALASEPEAPVEEPAPASEPEARVEEPAPVPAVTAPVPAPTGFAAELDKLFKERRFSEAYEGYTRYLQAHPGDIRSLYRQGISAVYLSEGNLFRTAELRSAVGAAVNAMSKKNEWLLAPEKDEELTEMLVYMTAHGVTFSDKLAHREECASQATGWVGLAGLYLEAVSLITSEEKREESLQAGVAFCDRALKFKASYFSGSTKTSGGKTKEEYTDYSLDKKQRLAIRDARGRLAESFNTLNKRTAEETRLNEDAAVTEKTIAKLKNDIRRTGDKFRASRKVFLLDKPEVKAGRGKILRNSLIIGGIVVVALGVFGFFTLRNDRPVLFGVIAALLVAFVLMTVKVSCKSLADYEAGQYPPELKALYDRLEDDKKQLKANKKHAAAARAAVKKFNESKL